MGERVNGEPMKARALSDRQQFCSGHSAVISVCDKFAPQSERIRPWKTLISIALK
jgi:hypothetical protein